MYFWSPGTIVALLLTNMFFHICSVAVLFLCTCDNNFASVGSRELAWYSSLMRMVKYVWAWAKWLGCKHFNKTLHHLYKRLCFVNEHWVQCSYEMWFVKTRWQRVFEVQIMVFIGVDWPNVSKEYFSPYRAFECHRRRRAYFTNIKKIVL